MSENVNARNINALADAAKADRTKREALRERIELLEQQVSMLLTDLQAVRQLIVTTLVARGSGPTTK